MTANTDTLPEEELLAAAVRFARGAGAILTEGLEKEFSLHYKGEVDIVTEMDNASQDFIEGEIKKSFPGHGILAEEGLDFRGKSDYVWIVDPLDGTTNYAHRFPVFSVSIAVLLNGKPVCGVVHDPVASETFTAITGAGALLNGHPINVSVTSELGKSLLATGFPYTKRQIVNNNLSHFNALTVMAQGIRRCGSAALDLCYLACGRFDGFWELFLKPWDIAAGFLIVTEAGGLVTDFSGNQIGINGDQVLATNGLIHGQMTKALLDSRPGQCKD